jgi:hypothetical protein
MSDDKKKALKEEFFLKIAQVAVNQCGLTKTRKGNIAKTQITPQRKSLSQVERGISENLKRVL